MSHDKKNFWANVECDEIPEAAAFPAEIVERPRRHLIGAGHPTAFAELPDLDGSTATPSRCSSNQQSRRSSGRMSSDCDQLRGLTDHFAPSEGVFPKAHKERKRDAHPRRLIGMDKPNWPERVGAGRGMGRGTASESEAESEKSLGRSSSMGSVGYASSSAYDSSLGPCASAGSSVTPRQRRPRSRSGSGSCEGHGLADCHELRSSATPPFHEMLSRSKGRQASHSSSSAQYTAEMPMPDRSRGMKSASCSALFPSERSDDSPKVGHSPFSRSGKLSAFLSKGLPEPSRKGSGTRDWHDVHELKLPMLSHSESAPVLGGSTRKGDRRAGSWANLTDTSVDEKEDDLELEVVDLDHMAGAPGRRLVDEDDYPRPTTAWGGSSRPRTRQKNSDGGTERQLPPSRGSTREERRGARTESRRDRDTQLSLCQKVVIHCPSSLPSKETFAQRKVPRPVSPLRTGASPPMSPATGSRGTLESKRTPSHADIGDLLQNMKRISRSPSVDSSRSNSIERAADVS